MKKDLQINIQTLLLEIEAYRSHSLFNEAKRRYAQLANVVRKSHRFKNKEKLLADISKKIEGLENDLSKFELAAAATQMSTRDQDLVKKLFVSSIEEESDLTALEGAEALLEFGQLEEAMSELNNLVENDHLRVVAAKNILRCHIGLSSTDNAIAQYQHWSSSAQFPAGQLEEVRSFLQDILITKGIDTSFLEPVKTEDDLDDYEWEVDFVDILSIVVPLKGKIKGRDKEVLDVSFQKEVALNVILPRGDQELIDYFKTGMRLEDIQFYSSDITFVESCVVSEKMQIKVGPKKGDYVLTIKILFT
ncbi:hypothetical protein ACFL6B_04435 [Thermodesulfobacteriota bacterium]